MSAFLRSLGQKKQTGSASSSSAQDRPQSASRPARIAKDVKSLSGLPVTEASYGKPAVYQIPLTEVMRNESVRIAKYDAKFEQPSAGILSGAARYVKGFASRIGVYSPEAPCTPKVLMVVGATGAGKTTLINGLHLGCNLGRRLSFQAHLRNQTRSDAYSQTSWITAYNLPLADGSRFPHPLTIIDTPGFGDTDGVERDKKIAGQIKVFFHCHRQTAFTTLTGLALSLRLPKHGSLKRRITSFSPSCRYLERILVATYS